MELLSTQLAERIVTEANAVIPEKISIMDQRGIIIAASDAACVGGFHEGAWMVLSQHLPELIVREDGRLDRVPPGLNCPIAAAGQVLGVLSVAGDYEKIADKARVIQRMAELMLSEAHRAYERLTGENVRNRYLDEWLNGDPKNIDAAFAERGRELNMDILIPRRVLACSAYHPQNAQDMATLRAIDSAEQMIERYIGCMDENNLFLRSASKLICMVTPQSDAELERIAAALQVRVEREYHLSLAIGIDDTPADYTEMHRNCVKAERALAACMRTHKWFIRKSGDLNMEVFADQVDAVTKQEYVRKIMRGFTDAEIAQQLTMLEIFYDHDGSITKTAERLFIHKNTLQYKLRRIAERTGYDPRSIRHSSLFYIAIYFYREIRDTMHN